METKETYQDRYTRAKARVEEIRAFYNHVLVYVIVISGIAALNYYQNQWEQPWFLFTLGGWGIGLLIHALTTFSSNPFTDKEWEKRKIQEVMNKERLNN